MSVTTETETHQLSLDSFVAQLLQQNVTPSQICHSMILFYAGLIEAAAVVGNDEELRRWAQVRDEAVKARDLFLAIHI